MDGLDHESVHPLGRVRFGDGYEAIPEDIVLGVYLKIVRKLMEMNMEVDTKLKIMDLPYDPIIPLFDNHSKDVQYFTEIHVHQCLLQDSPQ